jgi:hypothetical protein
MSKFIAKPRIVQRLIPVARLDDVFIDYVIYTCPIRHNIAIALEDNRGEWWTAPEWQTGGYLCHCARDCESYDYDKIPTDYNEISELLVRVIFEDFNGRRRGGPGEISLNYGTYPASVGTNGTEGEAFVLDGGMMHDDDYYEMVRDKWVQLFSQHYPLPASAKLDSHTVTIKKASSRFKMARAAKLREIRRRDARMAKSALYQFELKDS